MTSDLLIELAWKAILPSALTLLLLLVLKRRSPAEKSWIAHVGVMATLLLPLLVWAGPDWTVRLPAPVERLAPTSWQAEAPPQALDFRSGSATDRSATGESATGPAVEAQTAALILYLLPGLALLLLTLAGVARLIVLRRNARVLTDPRWISALANAQARVGHKHGTALLVSNQIASPVSWGVARPVILLDEQAASSPRHAEAIIAHELAHVAQADWAKLILCRVATALLWFNPLIWILARQCHQFREEAADDAVLKHQVADHDYVELLIHAARHESWPPMALRRDPSR
jgi:beta-lactamase regulating signal transducer with metallopeptidase domain